MTFDPHRSLAAASLVVTETSTVLGLGSEILTSRCHRAAAGRQAVAHSLIKVGYPHSLIARALGVTDAAISSMWRRPLAPSLALVRDIVLARCLRRWPEYFPQLQPIEPSLSVELPFPGDQR